MTSRPVVLQESFEGNLWVAQQVIPALEDIHVIRSWAAMNVNIDGAPILGESQVVSWVLPCSECKWNYTWTINWSYDCRNDTDKVGCTWH